MGEIVSIKDSSELKIVQNSNVHRSKEQGLVLR